jgi:hypothetical protein
MNFSKTFVVTQAFKFAYHLMLRAFGLAICLCKNVFGLLYLFITKRGKIRDPLAFAKIATIICFISLFLSK